MMEVESKPVWRSKTVWVNSVVLVLSMMVLVLGAVQGGELPLWFDVDEAVVGLLMSLVNLALRFVTGQPLQIGRS